MTDAQHREAGTHRARERERRRQEFLSAAWQVVTSEGLEALTMQSVSNIVGSAEGTIYNYFATKETLLAEMQETALTVVADSVLDALQRLHDATDHVEADPPLQHLAALLMAAGVWVDAEVLHPDEVELSRRIFTHTSNVFSEESGETVAASGRALLGFAGSLVDAAADAGALRQGDGFQRAVALMAGTTGILLTGGLARWDDRLLEARSFAHQHVNDLLLAWGAAPEALAAAQQLVGGLSEK